MNYSNKTKSDLLEIIKYRDNEIKEFQSLYAHTDIDLSQLKEEKQVLVYLLLLAITVGVLF